jgi:hypothetical protein
MTLSEVLVELECRGISLVRDGDRLRVEGKGAALPPELVQELQEHQGELLESLARCGWCKEPLAGPVNQWWRVLHEGGISYLCSAPCVLKAYPWGMEGSHDNRN